MAFNDEGGGVNVSMPVAPVGYGYGNNNNGGFGNDWSWIIIIFLFAMCGGGFGGGMGGFGGGMFPWLLASNANLGNGVQAGFDNAATASALAGIQTSLTTGFSNAEVAACNRAADAMQTAYNNQIASMNQNFSNQQALDNRLYAMQSQAADCCCENRLATVQTQNVITTDGAATRQTIQQGIQSINDKLCQLELDGYKRENDSLRSQLTAANLAASQIAQDGRIINGVYDRLATCPVGTMPVYGNSPIFTCSRAVNPGFGCGCGCAS